MQLIVGLGNPGEKYKTTRHNVGFLAIEKIQLDNEFNDWGFNKKFNAQISKGVVNGENTILAMPQTFMNNSGESVFGISSFYKIKPENITVIHDDIDIPLGELREQEDKGHGGHNGIRSVIEKLGTQNFKRIRIGINPSIKDGESLLKMETEKFVLQKFKSGELTTIKKVIDSII